MAFEYTWNCTFYKVENILVQCNQKNDNVYYSPELQNYSFVGDYPRVKDHCTKASHYGWTENYLMCSTCFL